MIGHSRIWQNLCFSYPSSSNSLLYRFTGCALVGLLIIASAYVLNLQEVNLNVSFDLLGRCWG